MTIDPHGTLLCWQAAMLASSTDMCSSLRVSPPPRTALVRINRCAMGVCHG